MIERIENNGIELGIIIRNDFKKDGIDFFTSNDYSLQLGYMNRPKGYIIDPHRHNLVERKVLFTQEVLFIKSGEVRIDFYSDEQDYLESRILLAGDIVLLAKGGHGIEMIEQSEIIEVKQGPYVGEIDKVRFEQVNKNRIKLRKNE